jgi:chromosome segregation ATPase
VQLDTRERDLTTREEGLAAKLRGKDEEIQTLLAQRTQELERSHKEVVKVQALAHADKLLEAVKATEAAEAAKVELETNVKKLEEDLVGNNKKILDLQESAQKTTFTLAELQTSLSSKTKELTDAANINANIKLKLTTLEENLEGAQAREKILLKDLEKEKALLANAENSFNVLKGSLQLWTSRLVEAGEQLSA